MMTEVVVFLTKDYSKNKSIWVPFGLSDDEIKEIVNSKFQKWYYCDIL